MADKKKEAQTLISCLGCGVVLLLERIQRTPHLVCPVCHEPLDDGAVDAKSFDTTDRFDPEAGRKEARDNARARVAISRAPLEIK